MKLSNWITNQLLSEFRKEQRKARRTGRPMELRDERSGGTITFPPEHFRLTDDRKAVTFDWSDDWTNVTTIPLDGALPGNATPLSATLTITNMDVDPTFRVSFRCMTPRTYRSN
jgi:hypothetical protein